jgi:hypothetical protein
MVQQNNELTKVKARIRALAAKTVDQGCSEEEAMTAAAMVGNLLAQYNLTMSEVDVRDAACITLAIDSGSKKRDALWAAAFNIGVFCGCKVWFQSVGRGSNKNAVYKYFGHETDVMMAEYLFKVIAASVDHEWRQFKLTPTYMFASSARTATASFKLGMTRRIGRRLHDMHEEAEAARRENEAALRRTEMKKAQDAFRQENAERAAVVDKLAETIAAGGEVSPEQAVLVSSFQAEVRAAGHKIVGGSSLIVLKGQLVEAEYEKLGMKLRTIKSPAPRRTDNTAYAKGISAGDKVNLHRPLNKPSAVSGLLA